MNIPLAAWRPDGVAPGHAVEPPNPPQQQVHGPDAIACASSAPGCRSRNSRLLQPYRGAKICPRGNGAAQSGKPRYPGAGKRVIQVIPLNGPHVHARLGRSFRLCERRFVAPPGRLLHLVVHVPPPESGGPGINRPAMTFDAQFLGKEQWKEIEQRYSRLLAYSNPKPRSRPGGT
ncbi:MAG: hypothetical protein J2P48_12635 [Alphaproteobacteria bacterium]|nr:hypothetical protein [Alphaproteobacteria bacterium]